MSGLLLALLGANVITLDSEDYVDFRAGALEAGATLTPDGFRVGETELVLRGGMASLGDEAFRVGRTFVQNGSYYVRGEFLAKGLYLTTGVPHYWDRAGKQLIRKESRPTVERMTLSEKPDSAVLTLTFKKGFSPEVGVDPGAVSTVALVVEGGFYPKYYEVVGDGDLVSLLRVRHTAQGARFELVLSEGAGGFDVRQQGRQYFLTVYRATLTPEERPQKNGLSLVVVDAGHGGKDPGAIGPAGAEEKDATLAIALLLEDELEAALPGVKVVLTRSDDTFIPLRDRTRIANRIGADLFISIHCNSHKKKKAHGTETYFLSAAKTDWEKSVAAFENSAVKYEISDKQGNGGILEYILSDMVQTEYLKRSSLLAESVQETLSPSIGTESRGVKQAGFYVLAGAYMPAILVETAFISNPDEERALLDHAYQSKVAKGIAAGVVRFAGSLEGQ